MQKLIDCAVGNIKADIVLKNATFVDVFGGEIRKGDIAIIDGKIAGFGENYKGEK